MRTAFNPFYSNEMDARVTPGLHTSAQEFRMPSKKFTSPDASVTRRRFLEQLGLVGGTSLVMTAMNSWELMAGQAEGRPQLTGKPSRNKVIVLGAGVSGLVTAYELGKLGYDVRILEARERVGGLNWTVRRGAEHTEIGGTEKQVCAFDEGLYVNVGPWRIPYTHTAVLNYCKELGVPLDSHGIFHGDLSFEAGKTALDTLLARNPETSAVFSLSEAAACGIMARAHAKGIESKTAPPLCLRLSIGLVSKMRC